MLLLVPLCFCQPVFDATTGNVAPFLLIDWFVLQGERPLSINMTGVRIAAELEVGLVSGCGQQGATVTDLSFPFTYTDIQFEFENIGTVLGTAVDVIGGLVIERERKNLVKLLKDGISSEVESLICENFNKVEDVREYVDTEVTEGPVSYDKMFNSLLEKEGGSKLIRDRYVVMLNIQPKCPSMRVQFFTKPSSSWQFLLRLVSPNITG